MEANNLLDFQCYSIVILPGRDDDSVTTNHADQDRKITVLPQIKVKFLALAVGEGANVGATPAFILTFESAGIFS